MVVVWVDGQHRVWPFQGGHVGYRDRPARSHTGTEADRRRHVPPASPGRSTVRGILAPMHRLLSIILLLAAGCGAGSDKTAVRAWDWLSPVEGERMAAFFHGLERTYEADHPDVDLRYQHIPFGAPYMQKIMASMAAEKPPDCLHSSIIWANDLYERGVLRDLRPYIEKTPEMADDVWLPAALRYGRDGDYVYGIPIEHDASCIIYNYDLFEGAGLDTDPFVFETWEDLRQGAIAMTRYDEDGEVIQAGFMVPPGTLSGFLPWMYANGGTFYTDDRRHSTFNAPAMREAMQFMQDLQYRDRVSFPMTTERQDFQFFLQGKVAMFLGGTWSGHMIEEHAPNLRFGMMSFPRGPRGTGRGGMTWTNMMCIPKGCKNPGAAWEYITYYCGMRNALWKLDTIARNSPLAAFYHTPEWNRAVQEIPSLASVPHITEVGGLFPIVRWTEMEALFQPLCEGLMLNNRTPEEVLDEAQPKVDAILEAYYRELQETYE